MNSLFIICLILQTGSGTKSVEIDEQKFGVKLTLETTVYEEGEEIKREIKIVKLGEKLRIDETFPNSEEIGQVVIWNGKECKLFLPNHNPQLTTPIRNGMDFIGFREDVKEKGVKWEIDNVTRLPSRKETAHEITQFKDYVMIEGFGLFPNVIERYEAQKLLLHTELKHTDKEIDISPNVFDIESVKFSEAAKKLADKVRPE
ncbi:MAG: hypothetical protein HY769_00065 [Candidatus Stahlbacteria bacterium]|nr:hypothetical protein [Candidatus Stahlbacteria bacterium]